MDVDERARTQIQSLERRIEDLERQVFGAVKSPPGPETDSELQEHLLRGDNIRAIKRYVELTGADLAEAKAAVDRMTTS